MKKIFFRTLMTGLIFSSMSYANTLTVAVNPKTLECFTSGNIRQPDVTTLALHVGRDIFGTEFETHHGVADCAAIRSELLTAAAQNGGYLNAELEEQTVSQCGGSSIAPGVCVSHVERGLTLLDRSGRPFPGLDTLAE